MEQALQALLKAGYQAWRTPDGCVEVMDPVRVYTGNTVQVRYVTRKLYSRASVSRFLLDRS